MDKYEYTICNILTLNTDIKKAHEGEYYCIVKNKFGQVKMNLFIQVFGLGYTTTFRALMKFNKISYILELFLLMLYFH